MIERRTCDIGGETAYSDDETDKAINTLHFDFAGVKIELECCGNCRTNLMLEPMSVIIEQGRRVDSKPVAKPKRKGKIKSSFTNKTHDGALPPYDDLTRNSVGKLECPSCANDYPTERGLQAHWTRQQNREMQEAS